MNLPAGVVRVLGKSVKSFDSKKELEDLSSSSFSGYVVETLFGDLGLEESALVFRQGQGLGCVYEYYGAKQTLLGDDALVHIMNAYSAEHGVLDIVDLSVQQVDLVTAFSPALKLTKPISRGQFKSLVKDSFDANLSKSVGPARVADSLSKESLFKKFGLAGIDGGK
ncbi:MAG: DUF2226 domain-containing protein [Candidatus Diapherotrites archaeon]|uniref:DUF2226 domain-containing protein n=1 Tax=Candidatus Iainarchaeum sp. TaxID=3101447 RepID=A0A8T4CBS3_9ARCH|nr:DUF2226 domain-containing protein [Candidatus Diapherotrites archaeon]